LTDEAAALLCHMLAAGKWCLLVVPVRPDEKPLTWWEVLTPEPP